MNLVLQARFIEGSYAAELNTNFPVAKKTQVLLKHLREAEQSIYGKRHPQEGYL